MYKHQWRKDTLEYRNAVKCVLIAVDEIITELSKVHYITDVIYILNYWQEVKQELEKLKL